MRRNFCSLLIRVHCILVSLHNEIVNAVFDIWILILLTREKTLMVCFIFSEEQRHGAFTGKCEITSQNHGFAVNADEVRKNDRVEVTHINLNDDTIEGIKVKDKVAFSVQYHPEAAPGPHDATYLFDQFTESMSSVMQEESAGRQ